MSTQQRTRAVSVPRNAPFLCSRKRQTCLRNDERPCLPVQAPRLPDNDRMSEKRCSFVNTVDKRRTTQASRLPNMTPGPETVHRKSERRSSLISAAVTLHLVCPRTQSRNLRKRRAEETINQAGSDSCSKNNCGRGLCKHGQHAPTVSSSATRSMV